MMDVTSIVAGNARRFREQKKLTLEARRRCHRRIPEYAGPD